MGNKSYYIQIPLTGLLLILTFTSLKSQVQPVDEFIAYQWTWFEVENPDSVNEIDCHCIYLKDKGMLKVLSKNDQKLTLKYGGDVLEFYPKSNAHFDPEWDLLEQLSLPTPMTREQQSVFQNFAGLWMVGEKVPDFDVDSSGFTHENLQGKVTVLNFWFAGCLPCRAEIPELNKVKRYYSNREDVQFISFSVDPELKNHENFEFQHYSVSKMIAERFWVFGYPRTFIIDRNGIIRHTFIGASPSDNEFIRKNLIEKIDGIL